MPSGNKGSGSRSKHGSKKRSTKTRSSLNVAGGHSLTHGPSGVTASSLAALPSSVSKSKKVAAGIYGNHSAFNNLVSQRKKTSSASKGKKGGKRQPNQGARGQPDPEQFHNMQAQIQAQQD